MTGEAPEWFPVIKAAKYLGVPPWELENQPAVWTTWALIAMDAEAKAEKALNERAKAQAKRR